MENCGSGRTFVEDILLLFALLAAAESSVDAVHEASALRLRGLWLLLGVAAASEVRDVVHCVWVLICGLWVVGIVGMMWVFESNVRRGAVQRRCVVFMAMGNSGDVTSVDRKQDILADRHREPPMAAIFSAYVCTYLEVG